MNRYNNIELVMQHGDRVQLEYGTEFGFFAHQIDRELLIKFCKLFNEEAWVKHNGYYLTTKYAQNSYSVALVNENKYLRVQVKLLDHSVYIDADDNDWRKLDERTFNLLHNHWRKFLVGHVEEYGEHIRKYSILADLQPTHAL